MSSVGLENHDFSPSQAFLEGLRDAEGKFVVELGWLQMLSPWGKVRIRAPRSDKYQQLNIRDKLLKISPHNTAPKGLVCSLHQKHDKLHVARS